MPVLRAEVDPPAVQQRRGLAAARQRPRPAPLAVALAQRDDPPAARAPAALEQRHVDAAAAERGRGRRQPPELPLPPHLAVRLAQRPQLAVVGELEERARAPSRAGTRAAPAPCASRPSGTGRGTTPAARRSAGGPSSSRSGARRRCRAFGFGAGFGPAGSRRVGRAQRRLRGRRAVLRREVGDVGGHRDPRPHEDRRSGRCDHDDAAAHRSRVESGSGRNRLRRGPRRAPTASAAPSGSTRRSAAAIASSVQVSGSSRNAA